MNFLQESLRDPLKSRILYDFSVVFGAVVFIESILSRILSLPFFWVMLLFPIMLVASNTMMNIYARFKTAHTLVKAGLLAVSVTISTLIYLFVGAPTASTLLIAGFSYIFMLLPRFFFNFYTVKSDTNVMATLQSHKLPILVVGGAGYIGSELVSLLLNRGHKVRVLDTFLFGRESLADLENNSRLEIIEGDVSDLYTLTQALNGVKAVVHLAGIVGDPACAVDEKMTRHLNISTTKMLKEAVKALNIPRFVFASSCSVYGLNHKVVDEHSALNPVSLYARTKIDGEKELLSDPYDHFHPTILRFATVFGHSRRPRFDLVANLFVAQAYNEAKISVTGRGQWRPFVHVTDVARAIVMVLESPIEKVSRQVFNVGSDSINITIDGLAELVQKVVPTDKKNREVKVVIQDTPGDPRSYRVSFKKIEKVLGFAPEIDLEKGLKEIAAEFRANQYQKNYKNEKYSNVATIEKYLTEFYSDAYRKTHIMPMFEDKK
jgi:nucleoside-diphosphate-sugar epimerase